MTDTPDIVEHVSTLPFEPTLERLTAAIKAAGLTLFCTIDHAAGAHAAGLEMPPATVLIYGNAKGGTPIMLAAPLVALDFPLRVLVQQRDDGKTTIAFHRAEPMLRRAGVAETLATRLAPAQQLLVDALMA